MNEFPARGTTRGVFVRLLVSLLGWAFGLAGPARAQERAYNNFVVGDRALGLSGAFVGLADDSSAAFHNPAGLARLPGGSLSTSLWAAALQIDEVKGNPQSDLGSARLDDLNVVGLPFFLAVNARLGPETSELGRRHAVALMIASPYNNDVSYRSQLEGTALESGLPAVESSQTDISDSTEWFGVSYAYRVTPHFSLGLTNFLATRFSRQRETHTRAERGPVDAISSDGTSSIDVRIATDSWNLLWRLAALWDVGPRIRLGLMVQPPGPTVGGGTTYDLLNLRVDPATLRSDFQAVTDGSLDVRTPVPWEVRGGGTYFFDDIQYLTADLSVLGGPDAQADIAAGIARAIGIPVSRALDDHTAIMRTAVGGQVSAGDLFFVRGGLHGEYAGSPTGTNLPAAYTAGGSLSLGIRPDRFEIALGATVSHNRSNILLANPGASPLGSSADPSTVDQTTIYLFLSGGNRAAKQLASRFGVY